MYIRGCAQRSPKNGVNRWESKNARRMERAKQAIVAKGQKRGN